LIKEGGEPEVIDEAGHEADKQETPETASEAQTPATATQTPAPAQTAPEAQDLANSGTTEANGTAPATAPAPDGDAPALKADEGSKAKPAKGKTETKGLL
jgi:hypothetical protein